MRQAIYYDIGEEICDRERECAREDAMEEIAGVPTAEDYHWDLE